MFSNVMVPSRAMPILWSAILFIWARHDPTAEMPAHLSYGVALWYSSPRLSPLLFYLFLFTSQQALFLKDQHHQNHSSVLLFRKMGRGEG